MLWSPRETLRSVGEGRGLGAGVTVVALWALASLLLLLLSGGGVSRAQFPELPPEEFERLRSGLSVVLPVLAFVLPFVWWAGLSALVYPATLVLGGRATLAAAFAFVGVACAPWAAVAVLQILLAGLQGLTGAGALGGVALAASAGALVWHAALVVAGARQAARLGRGGAVGSCALAGLGCLVAALFLAITLAALVVGFSGLPS